MIVYKSKFLQVQYLAESKIHENIWLPDSESMEAENYQEESLNFLKVLLEMKPNNFIADTRDMNFGITPDLQEWTNINILLPILDTNISKVAFVISKEMITQLSIEQTMEESVGTKLTTRYFGSREEALNWLLEN
jgi:hypothetical protein